MKTKKIKIKTQMVIINKKIIKNNSKKKTIKFKKIRHKAIIMMAG